MTGFSVVAGVEKISPMSQSSDEGVAGRYWPP